MVSDQQETAGGVSSSSPSPPSSEPQPRIESQVDVNNDGKHLPPPGSA